MKYFCPVCGRENPHITRQCPMRGSVPVCVECCKKCEHFRLIDGCMYHTEERTAEDIRKRKERQRDSLANELTRKRKYHYYLIKHKQRDEAKEVARELADITAQIEKLNLELAV